MVLKIPCINLGYMLSVYSFIVESCSNTISLFDNWNEEHKTCRVRLGFKGKLEYICSSLVLLSVVLLCLRNPCC